MKTPPIDAVLLDLDGTLVDTEPVGPQTMRQFWARRGVELTVEEWELFDRVWRRDGTNMTFEAFVAAAFEKHASAEEIPAALVEFYAAYEGNIVQAAPLPGVAAALTYLKGCYRLALVTASTTSQGNAVLARHEWTNLFDVVISHDDFQKSKPDPECFLLAAARLGVAPKRCAVVEDSKNGARAGKNAGMFVIGVRAGNRRPQDLSAADVVLQTLEEIQKIL